MNKMNNQPTLTQEEIETIFDELGDKIELNKWNKPYIVLELNKMYLKGRQSRDDEVRKAWNNLMNSKLSYKEALENFKKELKQ